MSTAGEAAGSKEELSLKRKKIIAVACNQCRSRKSRCDGSRPICRRCSDRGLTCVYEARENESRVNALKRDNQLLRAQLAHLENAAQESSDYMHSSSGTSLGVASTSVVSPLAVSPGVGVERLQPSSFVGGSAAPTSSQQESSYTVCMTLIRAMINRSDDEATLILAKLRTLTSWSRIVNELSDTSGGVASFMDGPREGPMKISPFGRPEPERQSSFGTWYNSLSSSSWLPIAFDRNIWKETAMTGKVASQGYQDHISVARLGVDDDSRQLSAEASSDASSEQRTAFSSHTSHVNVPMWALRSLTDPSLFDEPFEALYQSLRAEIDHGATAEALCGKHVYVAALYDEKAYRSAPKLSQVAATVVKSLKLETLPPSLTVMGMMWLYWTLLRWALIPSRRTYDGLPEIVRPTPSQLLVRHPFVLDFVFSPEMREHLCAAGNFELSWITPAFGAMVCELPGTLAEAVETNPVTGHLDLAEEIKEEMGKSEAWSTDASAEAILPDIGRFFKIRRND